MCTYSFLCLKFLTYSELRHKYNSIQTGHLLHKVSESVAVPSMCFADLTFGNPTAK